MGPKVSIITVSRNAAHTFAECLKSVASQTYPNIEHIVIDGASSDPTVQVAKQFQHVAQLVSEPDSGMYFAMNKGLQLATGDIIGFLHADDIYTHTEVIAKVVSLFEKTKSDTVYGDLIFVDAKNTAKTTRRWKSGPYQVASFYKGWMPPHPTFFVKKEIYKKFGSFNTSFTSAADYELMLRFLLKNKCSSSYLPEIMIRMRRGGRSTASLKNRIIAHIEDWRAWKVNGLQPRFFTLILKPLRKIGQFITYG